MKSLHSLLFSFFLLLFVSPVSADAALRDYFVDTQWLNENARDVKIIDVRVAPLYLLGHIDGALHIDKSEFLATRENVKSLIPTVSEFESLMTRYGITPDTTVVAYAEDHNPYSARFIWMLRYHGHQKAYVLDGGYDKWQQEDRPTSLLPTQVVSGEQYQCARGEDIRANSEDILTRLNNPALLIWDTRRLAEYQGKEVRADRGGHIPGAIHLDWVNLQKEVNGVRVLKSEQEIRDMLAAKGITAQKGIVAHCQTGIRSSYATLVLLGLGYENVRNYDGSWFEWANNSELPIVQTVHVAQNK